jgi:peptidoglycan hydrolase CwlO-like protein
MCRKLLIAGAVLLGTVILSNTEPGQFFWSQVGKGFRNVCARAPATLQQEHVSFDIAQLERQKQGLATEIADLKLDIRDLKGRIGETTTKLDRGKRALVSWANELEKHQNSYVIDGEDYTASQLKQKVNDTYLGCKLLEGELQSSQKLLAAKQKRHDALFAQVNALTTKIREFEVRLETVKTNQKILEVERISNPANHNKGRVNRIDAELKAMERDIEREVLKNKILNQTPFTTGETQSTSGTSQDVNLQEIRSYAQGNNTNQTAAETARIKQ